MSINKERIAIENIRLRVATFHSEVVQPALINFFFGNNGTGKSTIARVIDPKDTETGQPGDLTWHQGKSADDYSVLVYNQEFVRDNFQSYDHLKGVFTIGEENVGVQSKLIKKTNKKPNSINCILNVQPKEDVKIPNVELCLERYRTTVGIK